MSEKDVNKKDSGAKKIKRGAIMTGVVIGMGATFIFSSVASLVSKGIESSKKKKAEKQSKNAEKQNKK